MFSAIIALLIVVADIWAIINVAQCNETTGKKAIWVAVIFLFPLLGLIIWYLLGPKKA